MSLPVLGELVNGTICVLHLDLFHHFFSEQAGWDTPLLLVCCSGQNRLTENQNSSVLWSTQRKAYSLTTGYKKTKVVQLPADSWQC